MSELLEKANEYLKLANTNLNLKNSYFYDVPTGWMNDPNGCCYAFGKYHIFYQFHPYIAKPSVMYWGHTTTKDFINYENMPIAIAPDMPYDNDGCWSGSAYFDGKKIIIIYTGVNKGIQQQCVAYSYDGINFIKDNNNPVIKSSDLPSGFDPLAFRDPYIIKNDDSFSILLANKNLVEDCGQMLVYETKDFSSFKYKGVLIKEYENVDPGIFECPSLARLANEDILISSLNFMPDKGRLHKNFASVVYYQGVADFKDVKFNGKNMKLIDYGFDYYASQNLVAKDGRNIVVAWRDMWEKEYYNANSGWVGGLSLPREIKHTSRGIKFYPIKEVTSSFTKVSEFNSNFKIDDLVPSRIELYGSGVSFTLTKGNLTIKFYYSKKEKAYIMERIGNDVKINTPLVTNNTLRVYPTKSPKHNISIFIDNSCLEVYLDRGAACFTANYYGTGKTSICFNGDINKGKYSIFKK